MSNHTKQIVEALVTEDLFTAKKLINKSLMEKMSVALEEKLIDFAPTVFNESSHNTKKTKKMEKNGKHEEHGDTGDFKKKHKLKESEEYFQEELRSLIEEIEAETGEPLSEEEVVGIANDLLSIMNDEMNDDNDDCVDCDDDSSDDDSDDDYSDEEYDRR